MSSIIQNEEGTYTIRDGAVGPTVNPDSVCGQIQSPTSTPEPVGESDGD